MEQATQRPGGRGRDLDRFLTFLDAVVAIAITLLVLPLVDVAGQLQDGGSVQGLLRAHESDLLAFVISFVVIARQWFGQHAVVRGLVVQDTVTVRFLMGWLLMIVFLPFPTSLIATSGSDPVSKVLYLGTMFVASLMLAGASARIAARPEIRDTEEHPDPTVSVVTAGVFALTLGLSLAFPPVSYYPLLLLFLTDQCVRLWHRVRGGGPGPTPVGE